MDARRRRRSAAGRSGGIFEVVKDGDSFNSQYAAPDSEPYRRSGPTETETKSTKSNRTSRALKRINNRVSKFIHRKRFSENAKAAVTIEGGTEGVLPSTPTNHAHVSKPDSPFKEQMSLEADHELPHEEVNKEFFTPPRIRGADTKMHDIADGEVFD
ncbi:hypothetical protein LTR10_021538 [Elasticomyces elasticus]|nr:hypothetical protein LTR10_021538 [Elasticomyces elasticus]KAK5035174.1 hypothetical protein LTS07_002610 [Exophiala sideris]KAK5039474.1 hypothetical protein LTR13_003731 [Exophiala sideris]KAK5186775.1 hypothetical protein LTR44_000781 [Eurotiomycetes sp. CCFEE 6388]